MTQGRCSTPYATSCGLARRGDGCQRTCALGSGLSAGASPDRRRLLWAIVHDLRLLVCVAAGRLPQPSAASIDSRTLRSTVESGAGRRGWHKRIRGLKVHAVVDILGTLLAVGVTPANASERRQVSALGQRVQDGSRYRRGRRGSLCGCRLPRRAAGGSNAGSQHASGRRHAARGQQGLCAAPQAMVERSFAWVGRLRRLARDDERLPDTLDRSALRRLRLSLAP